LAAPFHGGSELVWSRIEVKCHQRKRKKKLCRENEKNIFRFHEKILLVKTKKKSYENEKISRENEKDYAVKTRKIIS